MRPERNVWSAVVRWSIVFTIVFLGNGLGPMVVAQSPCCFGDGLHSRPGIEAAVTRYYTTDGNPNRMSAYIFRFDSEVNALASLHAIDTQHGGGILSEDAGIRIDELGPDARAYAWEYQPSGVDEALILTVDGPFLYIVSITPWDQEINAVTLATTMIQAMIASPAGDDLGTFRSDGSSTGGLWDKLPQGGGEPPVVFSVAWDEQLYPEPELAAEEVDDDAFDFASLPGIQHAATRYYTGDMSLLASPETAPATTYYLIAIVAEFDTAEHAAASLETLHVEGQTVLAEDSSGTMESVDPGDLGNEAIAHISTMQEDGVSYEFVVVSVQADTYIHMVFALGIGTERATLQTATAVVEAMVETEVGGDEVGYDTSGLFLTGGLWDKLPSEGDEVLDGLVPESDWQTYP